MSHPQRAKCNKCIGGYTIKKCEWCKVCLIHNKCICIRCRMCMKKFPPKELCPKCSLCKDHHVKGSYIGKEFPHRKCEYDKVGGAIAKVLPTTFILNPLRRKIGVEIETAVLNDWDKPKTKILRYVQEHDGSVAPSGIEFVLEPAKGDRLQKGLLEFLRFLYTSDCSMNKTCGYHVHVDAIDLNYKELFKELCLFKVLQSQIFGPLVHSSRSKSEYCKPVFEHPKKLLAVYDGSSSQLKDWFHSYLYAINIPTTTDLASRRRLVSILDEKKAHKYENAARRQAINFHSWMMRGTIEFRCKEGTMDEEDFLLWPLWCGWFVEAGVRIQDTLLKGWLKSLEVDTSNFTSNKPVHIVDFTKEFMPPLLQKWVVHRLEVPPPTPAPYRCTLHPEDR